MAVPPSYEHPQPTSGDPMSSMAIMGFLYPHWSFLVVVDSSNNSIAAHLCKDRLTRNNGFWFMLVEVLAAPLVTAMSVALVTAFGPWPSNPAATATIHQGVPPSCHEGQCGKAQARNQSLGVSRDPFENSEDVHGDRPS